MTDPATPVLVRSPHDLTEAWLSARLIAAGRLPEGGTVTGFSTSAIGTGQMSESFRVALQYDEGVPAGPQSIVLKVAATDEGSRATGAGMGAYAREVRFYQQLAPTLTGPLAGCLHAEIDEATGWFTLLLEDLHPAQQGDQIAGCTLEEAAGAVDALAALQSSRWDEDALTQTDWLTGASPLNQGLLSYLLPGFEARYAGRVSEEHLQVVRRFIASADAWSAEVPRPHALVHADFRLDNMLFGGREDGQPVVVDWQTLTYGPALLDLSYFLGGSLSVDDRRAGEEALVRRYHEGLLAKGVANLDWDTCWREYRRQVFHGIVMGVAASMLVQRTDRGDDMFMTVMARQCQQAIDLDSVALLPDAGADAVGGALEPQRPDPADEGHHEPDADRLWNESWYMDFTTTEDGIAGYTRIGLYPNRGEAWITLALVQAGKPSAMLVDLHVPLPAPGTLAVTGGDTDLVADHVCVQSLQRFTVTCTGTGRSYEDPGAVLRGERGDPLPVSMDLEWETDGEPYAYRMLTRYEIPCRVRGTVRVGDETFEVDGRGQRDHSWGSRDWWAADWCWNAGALDDGTRFHSVEARLPNLPRIGMGYLQSGGAFTDLRTVAVDEEVAADGLVPSARLRLSPPDLDLTITALAHGPLLLVADDGRVSHFPRSLYRVTAGDGRTGLAWVEFNRNQPPA